MEYLEKFAKSLEGEELLILGGTGFFGEELLAKLIDIIDTNKIKTKIHLTSRYKKKSINKIPCLKRNYINIIEINFYIDSEISMNIMPSYILHMATTNANETYNRIEQLKKYDLLINATNCICKFIKNGSVKRIVFTSSGVIYGNKENPKESDYCHLNHIEESSSLAMGKLTSEYLLSQYCKKYKVKLSIARCFSFVGKRLPMNIHYAIGNFVNDAINERPIIIKGDGKDIRSYLNISDAINWLCYLLNNENAPEILNIGSGNPISIKNLAIKVKNIINPNLQIIIKSKPKFSDNMDRVGYFPNVSKAIELGLKETITLDSSIKELAVYNSY